MIKWGTYLIVGAIVAVILPFLLYKFGAIELSQFSLFPFLSIVLGSLGVLLHFISAVQLKVLNFSVLLILVGILAILIGVSLWNLNVSFSKYITLGGTLCIAVWIMLPNPKRLEE